MPALQPVGLGAWAFGGVGWGPQDDRDSVATIRHAVAAGVNWIDTAAVYGDGHAERIVGRALAAMPAGGAPAGLHQGRDPDRSRHRHDLPRPQPGLAAGRVRGLAAAPRGRAARPLPAALAGRRRRGRRSGLGDARRAARARARSAGPGSATSTPTLLERCAAIRPARRRPAAALAARRREATGERAALAGRRGGADDRLQPARVRACSPAASRCERLAALPEDDWRRRRPRFQSPEVERALAPGRAAAPDRRRARHRASPSWRSPGRSTSSGVAGAIVGARTPAQVDGWIGAAHA